LLNSDAGSTLDATQAAEAEQLLTELETAPRATIDLTKLLFGKQYDFVVDDSREGSACCTRRAGKTIGVVVKLARTTAAKPGSVGLYLTTNRLVAKRNAWDALKEWAPLFGFTLEPLEAELCVRHPNGSRVYLSGAKDKSEVEKFRGMPLAIVIIDESQSFRAYIEQLVDDVLGPALMDYAGAVWLIGTPGPVPVGYFYKATQRKDWARHNWSARDNPHIERKSGKTFDELLAHELKRRGVTVDHPSVRREWFGEWVLDTDALVFKYDAARNGKKLDHHDNYIICGDLGWDDADAIGVLGWSEHSPCVELVYEWVANKKTISEFIDVLRPLYEKFKPLAVVLDCGALGKKIAEEITQRTGIPIEAADKHRKLEHIELLNDAMRTDRFYAPPDSRFAQDCALVEWDRTNPEKPGISERYHSDICDAVLYGWRRALGWLYVEPPKAGPPRNSVEWLEAEAKRQQEEVERQWQEQFEANERRQQEESWP
jgi:hypothetical protein